MIFNYTNCCQ